MAPLYRLSHIAYCILQLHLFDSPESTALTSLSVASELNNGQRKNCAKLNVDKESTILNYFYNMIITSITCLDYY